MKNPTDPKFYRVLVGVFALIITALPTCVVADDGPKTPEPSSTSCNSGVLLSSSFSTMPQSASFGRSSSSTSEVLIYVSNSNCGLFADDINGLDFKVGKGTTLEFTVQARSSALQSSASLGFKVYSPFGEFALPTVSNIALAPSWADPSNYWNSGGGQLVISDVDDSLPESWYITGAAESGSGFLENEFVDVLSFDLYVSDMDGMVICIDTVSILPAGQWLMTPDGPPTWLAGGGDLSVGGTSPTAICVTTFIIPCLGPQYSTCVDSVTTSYCQPANYQVTAYDPDPPIRTISYTVTHDGLGSASVDSVGNVSYSPTIDEVNSVVTVTTFARTPFTCGDGAPCQTRVAVTYDSPQAVSAPNVSMYVGVTASLPAPSVIDADGCENYRWSLVGVSPIPSGSLTVDSVTGVITYSAVQADLALGSISVTTEVTDGINSSSCETIISFLCCLDPCCDAAGDADNSGQFNIADVTFLIARIFSGGIAPVCCGKADVDFSSSVNIADVTFMISRIFSGGPPPTCGPEGIICN